MLSLSHINHQQVKIKTLSLITSKKRVSFSSPFAKKQASITVEASLVLPIFLMYMMTLLYSLEIVRFQSDVWEAVHKVSMEVSLQKYVKEYGMDKVKKEIDVQQEIIDYLSSRISPFICVQGGKEGVIITRAENCLGKGNTKVTVRYEVKPFIKWLPIKELIVEESCLVHGFVGYEQKALQDQIQEIIYVFITPFGEKYHFDKECTYLKVNILYEKMEKVSSLRNASGEIYYACDVCNPYHQSFVYYTKWGNRFHGNSGCTALKRTVYVVPFSEVGERTPCSKCKNKRDA